MPDGRFPMMKYRVVCLFVALSVSSCLAAAQSSQGRSSSAKPGQDPLRTATKPLTPKSAMPAHRKSSGAIPKGSASSRNTSAELAHLERQEIKTPRSKSASAGATKGASGSKSTDTAAASGAGINFKYQKPVGGKQASKPDAHSANSSTPRVTKKN
jgi:hypothetical protein